MKKKIALLIGTFIAIFAMLAGSACAELATLPPGFEVTELNIPETATVGEEATITVTVKNFGSIAGTFYAPLLVNGEITGLETISLTPGESKTLSFTYIPTFGGEYEINIYGETGTISVSDSNMQKAMKMIPLDWSAFAFVDMERMRTDTSTLPGLSDVWTRANEILEYLSGQAGVNPAEDWPMTLAELDYLAISMENVPEGENPDSIAVIIGGTFDLDEINTFIEERLSAALGLSEGTYGTVITWSASMGEGIPEITMALEDSANVIVIGLTDSVEACLDVIANAGDDDSMYSNDAITALAQQLGPCLIAGMLEASVTLPDDGVGGLPETLEITVGFGINKHGERLTITGSIVIDEISDWIEMVLSVIPEVPSV